MLSCCHFSSTEFESLLERAAAGDRAAQNRLLSPYAEALEDTAARLLRRLGAPQVPANHVVDSALLRAANRLPSFPGPEVAFIGLLFKILKGDAFRAAGKECRRRLHVEGRVGTQPGWLSTDHAQLRRALSLAANISDPPGRCG